MFSLKQLVSNSIRVSNPCNSSAIIHQIMKNVSERALHQGIEDVRLSDHEFIYCTTGSHRNSQVKQVSCKLQTCNLYFVEKLH